MILFMNNQQTKKKIESLIKKVLKIDSLPLNASSTNVREWDSLAYLTIISKLENEFKLTVNQTNINNFNNIENIIKEINLCKKR